MTSKILKITSDTLWVIRSILKEYQLEEVFTPIMHNRLDPDFDDSHFEIKENNAFGKRQYLRICMELRLRQLLKFSLGKGVYEIGACFRKESEAGKICEFHMLELFEMRPAYQNLMEQIAGIVKSVYLQNNGKSLKIDTIPVSDLISSAEIDGIRRNATENDVNFIKQFEDLLDKKLAYINKDKKAYIIYDYPVETMSLAKRMPEKDDLVERFELFVDGTEIGHGFMDEMDADDVECRMSRLGWKDIALLQQLKNRELPESGGFGIGIDRLVRVSLGDESLKDKDIIVPQIL
jgi:lysyl-tRNA synthetase class 2